jgi:hypothetical protein
MLREKVEKDFRKDPKRKAGLVRLGIWSMAQIGEADDEEKKRQFNGSK